MNSFLIDLLDQTANGFVICGVIAITSGTLYTLYIFFQQLRHEPEKASLDFIRFNVGHSIVLGLEFFVGGDIIRTVITPDYYEIGILAILVIIRTILTYFLNQELNSLSNTNHD